ncbi:hypothetical protein GP2_029_00500 [Gordonia paraffinivorans NBRC 108238]|uniref:Uncharacterized protein n=1 Tax=Gordonia paraffinivorans NBRC 108238 TaxID=1223543 RepID=A0ABQ0INU7_9ACTN|nr:hypothetical protein GP2_029_00500 [Gordonia paraffinivorans NBRC 108238]
MFGGVRTDVLGGARTASSPQCDAPASGEPTTDHDLRSVSSFGTFGVLPLSCERG